MMIRSRVRWARLGLLALAVSSFASTEALLKASAPPVDPERQSAVFKRIFSYDKHLRGSDKIVVIVVSSSRNGDEARSVAPLFREAGLYPAVVSVAELSDDLTGTLTRADTVIYVTEDAELSAVKQFAAAKGFLTITGQPALVEAGHVSVSVDFAGEQPQVVVNMPRLQIEGHELSAELLKLARVIR